MTIKQIGGIFGRNPTFNDVTIDGQLTFEGDIDINSDLKVDGNLVVDGNGEFDSLDVVANGIKANANAAIGFQLGGDASGSTDIGKIVNNAGRFAIEPAGNRKFVVRTNSTKVDALEVDHNNNVSVPNGKILSGTTTSANGDLFVHIDGEANGITTGYKIRTGVDSASTASHFAFTNTNGIVGTIKTSGSATSFNTSSDYRLKEDVQPMSGATARLKELKPVNFAWKVDGSRVDGFLAHEAQEVVPESVTGTKDAMITEEYEVSPAEYENGVEITAAVMGTREVPDYQGIDQSKLVPLLVATIQELEARITALESN